MIDLYTWSTPNGRKISILLEELNIKYKIFPINIMKNEQFNQNFLKISPNNKIPAILDNENNISMTAHIITLRVFRYNATFPSTFCIALIC